MGQPLEGQVAVVVGSSSGMGRATALAYGRAGAQVVLAARRAEEVARLGGDEFTLLFLNKGAEKEMAEIAAAIVNSRSAINSFHYRFVFGFKQIHAW